MKLRPQLFALLLGLWLLGSACVTPPTPQEILATGFRTPEMTFKSFQVGVAADLPRLEYRCLSAGFRSRVNNGQGLSQLAYRELREQVLSKRLEFWLGIPDAEIIAVESMGEGRRLLRASSHGHEFELEMIREDYWQIWSGDELLADEALPNGSFPQWAEIYREDGRSPQVSALALLPSDLALRDIDELNRSLTEFRIGREWKIDWIVGLDASATP